MANGTSSGKTSPLLSLALLKGMAEHYHYDFLDTLRPFIFLVINKNKLAVFTDEKIRHHLAGDFGLRIPIHTIRLLLKRLSKNGDPLILKDKAFHAVNIPNEEEAFRSSYVTYLQHDRAILFGLIEYVKDFSVIWTEDEAEAALDNYLEEFSIECIKAHASGDVIQVHGNSPKYSVFLVSSFANQISSSHPEQFQYLLTVLQGRMIAGAIVGEEPVDPKMKFRNTTLFFDTPIVLNLLGLHGLEFQTTSTDTLDLVKSSGGQGAVFEHTLAEVDAILKSAGDSLELSMPSGRGAVVMHLRSVGASATDVIVLRNKVQDRLEALGIQIVPTPEYEPQWQIGEDLLEQELAKHGLTYGGVERKKRHDRNCVRSIYVLRRGAVATRIENCRAVFVTPNAALARGARDYGKAHHESLKEVSPVITDFSLTNILWLKHPVQAKDVPKHLLVANLFAVLRPSQALWSRYLDEIKKLEQMGRITNDDVIVLKTELKTRDELMHLTLGDPDEVSESVVTRVLTTYQQELVQPYEDRLSKEMDAHRETQRLLQASTGEASELRKTREAVENAVRVVSKVAKQTTSFLLVAAGILILIGTNVVLTRYPVLLAAHPVLLIGLRVLSFPVLLLSVLRFFVSLPLWTQIDRIAAWMEIKVDRYLRKIFALEAGEG